MDEPPVKTLFSACVEPRSCPVVSRPTSTAAKHPPSITSQVGVSSSRGLGGPDSLNHSRRHHFSGSGQAVVNNERHATENGYFKRHMGLTSRSCCRSHPLIWRTGTGRRSDQLCCTYITVGSACNLFLL